MAKGSSKEDEQDVMTSEEVSVFLRVDYRTVLKSVKDGKIPCQMVGNQARFSRSALREWLAEGNSVVEEDV